MEVDPPARIPANKVAARPKERAAVTPNALAGTPVRVLIVSVHMNAIAYLHAQPRFRWR